MKTIDFAVSTPLSISIGIYYWCSIDIIGDAAHILLVNTSTQAVRVGVRVSEE